jgi:hypothetical protein
MELLLEVFEYHGNDDVSRPQKNDIQSVEFLSTRNRPIAETST